MYNYLFGKKKLDNLQKNDLLSDWVQNYDNLNKNLLKDLPKTKDNFEIIPTNKKLILKRLKDDPTLNPNFKIDPETSDNLHSWQNPNFISKTKSDCDVLTKNYMKKKTFCNRLNECNRYDDMLKPICIQDTIKNYMLKK